MPTIKDITPEQQEKLLKHYADHTEVMRSLQIEAANEAQKYLWVTNGGAAVVLMAYMGSNAAIRDSTAAWTSLLAFFGGIVALGLVRAVNYHKTLTLFRGWIQRVGKAGAGETDYREPSQWLTTEANKKGWLPIALAYLAFAFFLFGSVWAATHIPQLARAQAVSTQTIAVPATASAPAAAAVSKAAFAAPDQPWAWKFLHDPNATFAGAVALFTLALVVVGVIQAMQLRRTVDATREAAVALPNIERAYVFIRVLMKDAPMLSDKGTAQSSLIVEIANHGRTPAILEQINAVAGPLDKRPQELIVPELTELPPGLVIAPSTTYELTVRYRVSAEEWQKIIGLSLALVCFGRIRYRDVLMNHRETGFCWEYQQRDDFRGLQISPDTPLNYWN
jgi:hypothetical protein